GRVQPGNQLSFEQLTVFDGVPISHCDSSTRTEEFKPSLESKNLPSSCEAAYSDITESLHVIPPLINSTVCKFNVDVVQRRRGCIQSADGRNSAFEAWSVNGEDFITFDPESQRWTAQSPSAVTVKQRWKKKRARNHFFSDFIRQQCPVLIQRIRLRSINPRTGEFSYCPHKRNVQGSLDGPIAHTAQILLICHVTSTDRPVSSVHLTGDGAPSARWITVTGPVPGPEDGSVVLRLTAEISLSQHTYRCAVQAGGHNISAVWGETCDLVTLDVTEATSIFIYSLWFTLLPLGRPS
uniref:MHC class I-like antigen recognition-like domain-containing protein n=1 Tax=Seriola lalandi dorsalis TaxID=1841481 RepID=A0A3B4X7V4_SERLL